MLPKEYRIQIVLYGAVVLFAMFHQSFLAIILLSVVSAGIWMYNHLDKTNEIDTIKQSVTLETEEANVRADDAFDKLVKLINVIPSPLVYINQRGDFEVFNQYFKALIGDSYVNVYDQNIDYLLRQTLLEAFLNEKQFIRQLNYKTVEYQVLSIPLLTDKKRYTGCMLIFQDVTRVMEGEKTQKRFIADASHELRTPITSIKGMVEILTRPDFNDDETRQEFLLQIQKENNRLNKIVEDLLLQSRLRANQVYIERTHVNLKQFFEGLIYERRQELQQTNIQTVINCPEDLTIQADQFRLSQVFMNLFNNAMNYAKGGEITITCRQHKENVKIEFKDSGEGIEADVLPHIFERFYRAETSRGRDSGGSGLGLAISKSIIEAHQGSIVVASEAGVGTTFMISLSNEV